MVLRGDFKARTTIIESIDLGVLNLVANSTKESPTNFGAGFLRHLLSYNKVERTKENQD